MAKLPLRVVALRLPVIALGFIVFGCTTIATNKRVEYLRPGTVTKSQRHERFERVAHAARTPGGGFLLRVQRIEYCRETFTKVRPRITIVERRASFPVWKQWLIAGLTGAASGGCGALLYVNPELGPAVGETLAGLCVGSMITAAVTIPHAVVDSVRARDGTEPTPDEVTRWDGAVFECSRAPAASVATHLRPGTEFTGRTDSSGLLVVPDYAIRKLARRTATATLQVEGGRVISLDIKKEHLAACASALTEIRAATSSKQIRGPMSSCADTQYGAEMAKLHARLVAEEERRRIAERDKRLEQAWVSLDRDSTEQLRRFIAICDREGDGPHCRTGRDLLRERVHAAAVATCGLKFLGAAGCNRALEELVGGAWADIGCAAAASMGSRSGSLKEFGVDAGLSLAERYGPDWVKFTSRLVQLHRAKKNFQECVQDYFWAHR